MNAETADLLASFAAVPAYPEGDARRPFEDPRSRPMALIMAVMADSACDDPWGMPQAVRKSLGIDLLPPAIAGAGSGRLEAALGEACGSPRKLAGCLRDAAALACAQYGGDMVWAWNAGGGIDAPRLFSRLTDIPGIGPCRALTLMDILERDWGVTVTGWEDLRVGMKGPMARTAARLGWLDGMLPDPRKRPAVYEGIRFLASGFCLGEPACGACPMTETCPKNGVG
jgi:endonuclease III